MYFKQYSFEEGFNVVISALNWLEICELLVNGTKLCTDSVVNDLQLVQNSSNDAI